MPALCHQERVEGDRENKDILLNEVRQSMNSVLNGTLGRL